MLNDAGAGSGCLLRARTGGSRRLPLRDRARCRSRLRPWGALQRALELGRDIGAERLTSHAVTGPIAGWLGLAAIRRCVVCRHARIRAASGDHRKAGEHDDGRNTTPGVFQDDLSDRQPALALALMPRCGGRKANDAGETPERKAYVIGQAVKLARGPACSRRTPHFSQDVFFLTRTGTPLRCKISASL